MCINYGGRERKNVWVVLIKLNIMLLTTTLNSRFNVNKHLQPFFLENSEDYVEHLLSTITLRSTYKIIYKKKKMLILCGFLPV